MVYRLLGCVVVNGDYHKIQIASCASEKKLHLIIELVHRRARIRNILRFYEVGGNTGV